MAIGKKLMISVIIPTYNRREILVRCLEALARQTLPHDQYEVVVCDDGSTDDTAEIITSLQLPYSYQYLYQSNRGPAAARNMGLDASHGDLILFLNDDAIAKPDLLQKHLQAHDQLKSRKFAVLGRFPFFRKSDDCPLMEVFQNTEILFQYARLKPHNRYDYRVFWTCNISLWKDAFTQVGRFDEDFHEAAGEDIEMGYRLHNAGYQVFYEPACVAKHDHKISLFSFYKRSLMIYRNLVLLLLKHPEIRSTLPGIPVISEIEKKAIDWLRANEISCYKTFDKLQQLIDHKPRNLKERRAIVAELTQLLPRIEKYWAQIGYMDGVTGYFSPPKARLEKLNFTFLTPGTEIAGGIKIIFEYCNQLASLGHTVNLISFNGERPNWFDLDKRVRFILFQGGVESNPVQLIPDADVIFATFWTTAFLVSSLPSSKGEKFYLIQDYEAGIFGPSAIVDPTYILPLHRIVVSSWLQKKLSDKIGVSSILVNNGLDGNIFFPKSQVNKECFPNEFRIGLLYHTDTRKGFDIGWQAIQAFKKQHPEARSILFGREKPTFVECDEFYQGISRDEVRNYYHSLDVFVSSSFQEGFGLPGLEALACGIPLITTASGGVSDYAIDDETALVVPPGNIEAIVSALLRLCFDQQLGAKLSRQGIKKARTFSWENASKGLLQVVYQVLEDKIVTKSAIKIPSRNSQETLENILSAEDIHRALIEYEREFNPQLLKLIRLNQQFALEDGHHDLADGLKALYIYIEAALTSRKKSGYG